MRRPRTSTLFPYTTLFRSLLGEQLAGRADDLLAADVGILDDPGLRRAWRIPTDRKSTRLNSSHVAISYAVFCLKKKKRSTTSTTVDTRKRRWKDYHRRRRR